MWGEVWSFWDAERTALEEKNKEPRRNPNKNKPTKLSKKDWGNVKKMFLIKNLFDEKKHKRG